ncbi:MAG: precorrin-6Y C5,15-methyltransferase (decarboxylating) subunit CbiT, partial [Rikenellaceae bacterium]|nr:precorrin-6Y C5,15-methyltransferase (decarboxylating) subunit CbiT [Rikenellaceae bacterium]
GEHLGGAEEKITVCTVEELFGMEFSSPNNLILIRSKARYRPFGIPDSEFHLLDGRQRMITKMPVRLATLHSLDLRERNVFWDIGFCTGSVSIEAKLQFPHLDIVAFEKRESCGEIIRANMQKFGAPGILPVTGDFLTADICAYPPPDAVFIGGHGGKMREILEKIAPVMNPGAIVVFNAVSEDTRNQFMSALRSAGFRAGECMSVKVNDFNPIEVMQAIKL